MRPGQAAPEFSRSSGRCNPLIPSFNEAGAGCPGILRAAVNVKDSGIRASMRPGQAAPEFSSPAGRGRRKMTRASMRPGQAAPEFKQAADAAAKAAEELQ